MQLVVPKMPENHALHLANSSTIRYAQLFKWMSLKIYWNRGTSGIHQDFDFGGSCNDFRRTCIDDHRRP